jgi:hypothetical protein
MGTSQERNNMDKCKICGKESGDTRLGVCWECAEAESIIDSGKDMYDKGDAKTAMQKLKMLIQYGWSNPLDGEIGDHE